MRKLFTYFATLCCAMFFSVPSVMATLSDGAIISVGGTSIADANKEYTVGSGNVSYDASSHTLSLNGVSLTKPITIDADSKIDAPVTIYVEGECKVSVTTDAAAIQFSKGKNGNGLVIEGGSDASLTVNSTATSYSAILCSNSQDGGDLVSWPFTVKGGMTLKATSSNSSKTTLYCGKFEFNGSNIELTAKSGVDAITNILASSTTKMALIKNGNKATGYAFKTAYGIAVNGVPMSDVLYSFDKNILPGISSGTISYDAAKNELILENFAITSANASATNALAAISLSQKDVVVKIKGNGASIDGSSSYIHKGLMVAAPATIDLNGYNLAITSN